MALARRTFLALTAVAFSGCRPPVASASNRLRIGVSFETLQTPYWVRSLEIMREELARQSVDVVEAIADGDANRQLEQVNSFISRRVNALIVVPRDAQTILPIIRAANNASIPIVLYNRSAAENAGPHVAVVADNRLITKNTVAAMLGEARKAGRKLKGMILVGDLSDANAINRQKGFDDALAEAPELVEMVARVPTEWNQEKALAGVTNAFQAHPDIEFLFTSSDFLFPSIVSALKSAGRYRKIGEEGHVIMGGFDGDAMAYQLLVDRYLDADGVQDVFLECRDAVTAATKLAAGEKVEPVIRDEGFVIHQGNLQAEAHRMWGSGQSKAAAS